MNCLRRSLESMPKKKSKIPQDAVLLIPLPEVGKPPAYGIKPGYYNKPEMLALIELNKGNPKAIHFIADMLETGDPADDGFANTLRRVNRQPALLARTVRECWRTML